MDSVLRWFPEFVVYEALATLQPTGLTAADVVEWRKGSEHVRRVTSQGYEGPRPP